MGLSCRPLQQLLLDQAQQQQQQRQRMVPARMQLQMV
jgi:hypothetical protein